jgi:hypothetical protein
MQSGRPVRSSGPYTTSQHKQSHTRYRHQIEQHEGAAVVFNTSAQLECSKKKVKQSRLRRHNMCLPCLPWTCLCVLSGHMLSGQPGRRTQSSRMMSQPHHPSSRWRSGPSAAKGRRRRGHTVQCQGSARVCSCPGERQTSQHALIHAGTVGNVHLGQYIYRWP